MTTHSLKQLATVLGRNIQSQCFDSKFEYVQLIHIFLYNSIFTTLPKDMLTTKNNVLRFYPICTYKLGHS